MWCSNLVGQPSRKSSKMATCLRRWGRSQLPLCDVPISWGNPQESPWRWPLVLEDEGEVSCLCVTFQSHWATLKKVLEDGHLSQKMRENPSAFVWRSNLVEQPSRKSSKMATCLRRWGRSQLPSCDVPISWGNPQESPWSWPLVSEDEGELICLHVMFQSRWATLKNVLEDGHLSQKMREKASSFVWRFILVGQPSRMSLKTATCLRGWRRTHLPSCDVPISLGNPQESPWRWLLVSEDEGEGICLHVMMFQSRWATLKKVLVDGHLSQKMREKASSFMEGWKYGGEIVPLKIYLTIRGYVTTYLFFLLAPKQVFTKKYRKASLLLRKLKKRFLYWK